VTAVEIDRPLEISRITRLKIEYARLVDAKDWRELIECFTDDFQFEGRWSCTGPEAFVDRVSKQLADAKTTHRLGAPSVGLVSSDEAAAVWPFSDIVDQREDGTGLYRSGSGDYHERYRKLEGQWRIAAMRITREQVECSVFVGGLKVRTELAHDERQVGEWLARERGLSAREPLDAT